MVGLVNRHSVRKSPSVYSFQRFSYAFVAQCYEKVTNPSLTTPRFRCIPQLDLISVEKLSWSYRMILGAMLVSTGPVLTGVGSTFANNSLRFSRFASLSLNQVFGQAAAMAHTLTRRIDFSTDAQYLE
jgi:hypothetical protein